MASFWAAFEADAEQQRRRQPRRAYDPVQLKAHVTQRTSIVDPAGALELLHHSASPRACIACWLGVSERMVHPSPPCLASAL